MEKEVEEVAVEVGKGGGPEAAAGKPRPEGPSQACPGQQNLGGRVGEEGGGAVGTRAGRSGYIELALVELGPTWARAAGRAYCCSSC